MRIRGLEALKNWMADDMGVIEFIGRNETIMKGVSLLGMRTIDDTEYDDEGGKEKGENEEGREGETEEGKEEGVSVREKNGILGIVLEVVEGGGWRGSYEELEELVGRLEEEGEKGWRERRREKGRNVGREWKEMGRLSK